MKSKLSYSVFCSVLLAYRQLGFKNAYLRDNPTPEDIRNQKNLHETLLNFNRDYPDLYEQYLDRNMDFQINSRTCSV